MSTPEPTRSSKSMTPDGEPITLSLEEGHYVVRVGYESLMSSEAHGSEQLMAELACRPLAFREDVRILIGGLGLGFTLRAALDELGDEAEVVVAELLPVLVEWHRGLLGPLADHALDDPRVRLSRRWSPPPRGARPSTRFYSTSTTVQKRSSATTSPLRHAASVAEACSGPEACSRSPPQASFVSVSKAALSTESSRRAPMAVWAVPSTGSSCRRSPKTAESSGLTRIVTA